MWSHSVVRLGEHDVCISARRLDPHERQQVAASLAWLTLGALHEKGAASWEAGVGELLHEHVRFRIELEDLSGLEPEWWSALLNAALMQFMHDNDLSKLVHHQMFLLQSGTRPSGLAS